VTSSLFKVGFYSFLDEDERQLNWSAKTPVEIDRFMILLIIERRTQEHCFEEKQK
jgi:hypothetical protein